MNKPRIIEGRWWIHGDDKEAHFGTLSFDPERGLELTVKVPLSRTIGEALHNFTETPNVPQVIHGKDEHDHDVTLFGYSRLHRSAPLGLDTYQMSDIGAAMLNYRGQSLEESRFAVASVNYTLLHQWMNRKAVRETTMESGLACVKFQPHDLLEFQFSPGVRLRIEGIFLPSFSLSEYSVRFLHRAWFLFSELTTAKTIYDEYASVLLRLLCLLTGERVFIEEFVFYDRDPFEPGGSGPLQGRELLIPNSGVTQAKRDLHAAHMIASFEEIEASLGSVLKRWFECHERFEPVIDLYFAVLANRVSSAPSAFLFLAQALEVYHARSTKYSSTEMPAEAHKDRMKAVLQAAQQEYEAWMKEKLAYSNQKTLAKRLEEILNSHPAEATRLTAGVAGFAAKVRHTRNYYTHYDEELREKGKVAEGLELRRIIFALLGLIQICLLKELGIQGKPIDRILERNTAVRYADEQPSECATAKTAEENRDSA